MFHNSGDRRLAGEQQCRTCFPAQAFVAYPIKAFNQAFLLPSCAHLSALMRSNKPHGVHGFTKATP